VKRVITWIWAAIVGLLLMFTMLFGPFDAIRLGIDKLILTPTTGSYHEPIMTTLTIISGVVGALVTVLLLGTLLVRRVQRRHMDFGGMGVATLSLFALAAVTGLWLPFVHTNEVDVTPGGFAQSSYEIAHTTTITVYNATSGPMTICVGAHSTCTPDSRAPAALNGLHLAAGQAIDVDLTDIADYTLTIATPTPGMSSVDTVMHAVITDCENYPDNPAC
jgi:hypothetical protein